MPLPRRAVAFALLLTVAAAAPGQTSLSWTAAASADWFDPANWSPAQIPTASDLVTIDGALAATPATVLGATAACRDLVAINGGRIVVDAAAVIEVGRDVLLSGPVVGAGPGDLGTLRLVGPDDADLSANSAVAFGLDVAKSGGVVTLAAAPGLAFRCDGGLTATNAALVVGAGGVAAFGGPAQFVGGSFACADAAAVAQFAASASFSGAAVGGLVNLACSGDVAVDAAFAPTSGLTTLVGAGARQISGLGRFFDLDVAAGGATTAVELRAAGVVRVLTTLVAAGDVDCDGLFDVAVGASYADGGFETRVGGHANFGGTTTLTGALVLDGAASTLVQQSAPLANVRVEKSGGATATFASPCAIVGDLDVVSGVAAFGALDVDGATTITAGATLAGAGAVVLGGDLTSAGALTALGGLVFDGPSSVATAVALPTCAVQKPGATLTLGATTFSGDCGVVAGALAAAGALVCDGTFAVFPGATFSAGAFVHEFRGPFLADGTTTASGTFRFAPPNLGVFALPTNVRCASGFPSVVVDAAGRSVSLGGGGGATVNGAFDVLAGGALIVGATTLTGAATVAGGALIALASLTCQSTFTQTTGSSSFGALATVAGHATFAGGTFSSTGPLDVAGNVVFSGATAAGAAHVRCAGNWTSDAAFDPTTGAVTLDGAAPQGIFGAPVLRHLVVAAGATATAHVATRVRGTTSIVGALTAAAPFDADGAFVVGATGLFDTGPHPHRFGGAFSVAAGGIASQAGARLTFDGAADAAPVSAATLPDVEAAKDPGATLTLANLAVGGDLLLASGALATGAALTVAGEFIGTGGTLTSLDPATPVAVGGQAAFAGAAAIAPALDVAGDFASDAAFAPTGGRIRFVGAGQRSIAGHGDFGAAAVVCAGGTTSAIVPIRVDGDFVVEAAGAFDGGTYSHCFGGDFLCLGALAPDGAYQFDAAHDQTLASVAPLPTLNVNKADSARLTVGDAAVAATTECHALLMSPGRFVVAAGTTLHVATNAQFVGGEFATEAGAAFDVDGDLSFSSTSVAAAAEIRVGGAFGAGPGFEPASGAVVCDGAGLQQLTHAAAAASLFDFVVGAASTVDVQGPTGVLVRGATTVDGVLQSAVPCSYRGPVTVSVTGSFDGGDASSTFGDDVLVFGQMIHVAQLVANGAAAAELGAATQALPPVVVNKTAPGSLALGGTLPFSTPLLTLQAGFAFVPASTTAAVYGPAMLVGGSFASQNREAVLAVAGDVLFAGCVVSGLVSLDAGGALTADPDFAPTSGRVRFTAPTGSSMQPDTPGGPLYLPDVVVTAGTASVAVDAQVLALSVTVDAGATLRVAGATATFGPTTFSVAGEIFVDDGGALLLDDAAPLVVPAGATLRLVGHAGTPAVLGGAGPLGSSVRVEGHLAASNFRIQNPAAGGFVIDVGATLAAAPDDFRGGALTGPRPGGALLDVRRAHPAAAATEFRYLTFENPAPAAGAKNVRSAFGTPLLFTNCVGPFTGAAFEDDPTNRIGWGSAPPTQLAAFVAVPGASVVTATWVTSAETDAAAFVLERRQPPATTFSYVGEEPAAGFGGQGAAYTLSDTTVASGVAYEYRVSVRLTHGALVPLGTTTAQTLLLAAGAANVFGVGVGRSFATPQDALDAAALLGAPRPIVRLSPGTYPAFTITATAPGGVRVVADGPGVVVDASLNALRVQGLGAGSSVELVGLVVDAFSSAEAAIVVENCAAPVVLDRCHVYGDAATPGIRCTASVGLALQRTDVSGLPGLRLEGGSAASAVQSPLSTLVAVGGSKLRASASPIGAAALDPASTLTLYPGVPVLLDAPSTTLIAGLCPLTLEAAPLAPYLTVGSAALAYTPPAAPFELPLLVDLVTALPLAVGVADAQGRATQPLIVPASPALLGFTVSFQSVAYDPATGAYRLSTVQSTTVVG
jgi:hypothetical protein